MKKTAKILGILLLAYVGLVVLFESSIGYFQPERGDTLRLTVRDADGSPYDRVVSRIESEGKLYVAVNHWPRGWYHKLKKNPLVKIEFGDQTANYNAVEITDAREIEQVRNARPMKLVARFLMGFPPRKFIRFDPLTNPERT